MSNKIKLKRGLSSKINSVVLDDGEIALTTDTNKLYSKKGEIAPNNVYVGASEPSNSNIECWINPNASFDPTAYFDRIYPVGSLYMSVNSTDPSKLFGGTWTKIEGSFLWGTGNTPKHTGGSTTTNSHVLKVNEIPAHVHSETIQTGDGNFNPVVKNRTGGSTAYAIWPENATGGWTNVGSGEIMTTRATGGGEGHSHTYMPPYFEVYMWYRIK